MTWTVQTAYTPSGGPVAAGSVGNGWTDVGGVWSITSGNVLTQATGLGAGSPWNTDYLSRLATGEHLVDQRIQVRFTQGSGTDFYVWMRQTGSGTTPSGLIFASDHTGTGKVFVVSAGSLGASYSGAMGFTPVAGTDYDLQVDCVQTDATHTTISAAVFASTGGALCSGTLLSAFTPLVLTDAGVQNVSGGQGFFVYGATAPLVKLFSSFTDAAGTATGLAWTPATATVVSGVASSFTVAANGSLAGSHAVVLADGGAGGTFSPASLTLTSASPSATMTYTPVATGAITLTASSTGLASGTAAVTSAAPGAFLDLANASVVLSPYNWTTGLAANAARTWNTGSYVRAYVTGCTSVSVVTGPSNTGGTYFYTVDDGAPSTPAALPSSGSIAVTLPDAGNHVVAVYLNTLPQAAGRWAGTNCFTVNGFQLGAGGTGRAATRGAKNLLLFGDSISEGIAANNGSDNWLSDYSYLVASALFEQGWEYGIVACGYSGYSVAVAAGNGGTLAAFVPGADAASWWNKVDGTGMARVFVPQPDVIVDVWGANDSLQGASAAVVQAAIAGLYAALRAAAPHAVLLNVVPFGGYERANIVAALGGMAADGRRHVVDLAIDARQTVYGGVHPGVAGHAAIAPMVMANVLGQWMPTAINRWSHS